MPLYIGMDKVEEIPKGFNNLFQKFSQLKVNF